MSLCALIYSKIKTITSVDSHARDMYGNSHSEGTCILLEIKSMHKLVQYFQSLYGNEDIYL